jgi:hypothetical protein
MSEVRGVCRKFNQKYVLTGNRKIEGLIENTPILEVTDKPMRLGNAFKGMEIAK